MPGSTRTFADGAAANPAEVSVSADGNVLMVTEKGNPAVREIWGNRRSAGAAVAVQEIGHNNLLMRLALAARLTTWRLLRKTLLALRRRLDVFWVEVDEAPRPPVELPIPIAAVGGVEIQIPPVGFQLDSVEQPEHARETAYEIVIVRGRDLGALLRIGVTARLVICGGMRLRTLLAARHLPEAVALIYVPATALGQFVSGLLRGLASDLPLKDAARTAARTAVRRASGSILILGRRVNHAFRLGDIADIVKMECEVAGVGFDATKSATSLALLAAAHQSCLQAEPEQISEEIRSTDLHCLRGVYRQGRSRVVPPGVTLQCDCDYLVQIHVGKQLHDSLLTVGRDASATDVSNPGNDRGAGETDLLEIALQPKDFTARGPDRVELALPREGTSRFVYFAVRTPAKPRDRAELRMILYRRNRIIESLLLASQITEIEQRLDSREVGISAAVEFSQARSFEGLPFQGLRKLLPRMVTLSVNQSEATHEVMVKGGSVLAPLSLSESKIKSWTDDYRKWLENATHVSKWDEAASRKHLTEAAHLGSRLYLGTFRCRVRNPRLEGLQEHIRQAQEETISVVRHDAGFTFPWPLFYDWPLPPWLWRKAARITTEAQICLGRDGDRPCGHTSASGVYCVRGFWGYRFRIEEIIGDSEQSRIDVLQQTQMPLQFLVCTKEPANAQIVAQTFQGKQGVEIQACDLPDKLWIAGWRAPVVALFAHQDSDVFLGVRLVIERDNNDRSPKTWLSAEELAQLAEKKRKWVAPSSIVLLLACESAATSPETLTDFVLAFHRAGAAAVVGTEAEADAILLNTVGGELVESLLNRRQPLGEALRRLRIYLLEQGNPLAFLFTSAGNADLRIE